MLSYHRKKFHTAISPSLPVLTICLSSGENFTLAIALEWARHSVMKLPVGKSYILTMPSCPPVTKYLLL